MHSALIIGYGSIGKRHKAVLSELYPQSRIDIVSAHSPNGEGIFPSLEAVPDLAAYDYYVICSETCLHGKMLEALESKVAGKRVLVEKPLLDRLYGEFTVTRNSVYVGYNLRYHPTLMALRSALVGRKILSAQVQAGQYLPSWHPGQDYRSSYSASAARGGGVLLDLSHELDYSVWLFGTFHLLYAVARKVSSLLIDSDDLMQLLCMTDRGAVVSIGLDYLSRIPQRRIQVQCEGATFIADLNAARLELAEGEAVPLSFDAGPIDRNESYRAMHLDILEGGARDACTVSEALATLQIIERIRESDKKDWSHD